MSVKKEETERGDQQCAVESSPGVHQHRFSCLSAWHRCLYPDSVDDNVGGAEDARHVGEPFCLA